MSNVNELYWNVQRTYSHNCMFNWVKGIRGCGKTHSMTKWLVEKYLKLQWQFVWVRRNEEELKKLTIAKHGRFFNDVQQHFPEHVLWAESNVLHCDKEVMGIAQPLTTAKKLKGDVVKNVRNIVFDEYQIDTIKDPYAHYLPDEVTSFLELCETVARYGSRDYEPTIWFLGNNIGSDDPYTSFFHLCEPYLNDIWKKGECLVQFVAPPALIEKKKATRFYQALEGTSYADYAVENIALRDDKKFIKKKGQKSEYQFTLIYYNDMIGVWRDYRNGCYYISPDVDKQCHTVYACTTEDMKPNLLLLKGFKSSRTLKDLKKAYDLGCVYYENQTMSNAFRDIIRMGL